MNENPLNPTLRTQHDLEQTWRTLMSPLGWSAPALWAMLIRADDRPIPQLIEIGEIEDPPEDADALAGFLREVVDALGEDLRVAFLLARPGAPSVTGGDRGWAVALHAACRRAGLPCETVHLATDTDVQPLPMDEVGVA